MRTQNLLALALAGSVAAAAGACGSSRVSLTGDPRYGKTAEDDYNAGLAEAKGNNTIEAQKFLEHVRSKYPFSKYAALAELKLADLKFDQEKFPEAAEAYGTFVRMHPTHEQADSAAFKQALALIRDAPVDFIAFPPSHERELKTLREGTQKMAAFLARWPDSPRKAEGQKLLAESQGRLADHEWYVAGFYAKRNLWAGAAGRYETLVKTYPGSKHEVEAWFALADACVRLDDRYRARQALQQFIVKHPGGPEKARAEKQLAELR